jgi:toxin CptA
MILSKALLHCRLDWRPSFLLQIILLVLMCLAILSLAISALPWYFAAPLCGLVLYINVLQIKKLRRMPHCSLFWRAGDDAIALNFGHLSESLTEPRCHQQGPLWIISALDASRQNRYFVFLPDTITRSERRLLRLVAATPLILE